MRAKLCFHIIINDFSHCTPLHFTMLSYCANTEYLHTHLISPLHSLPCRWEQYPYRVLKGPSTLRPGPKWYATCMLPWLPWFFSNHLPANTESKDGGRVATGEHQSSLMTDIWTEIIVMRVAAPANDRGIKGGNHPPVKPILPLNSTRILQYY